MIVVYCALVLLGLLCYFIVRGADDKNWERAIETDYADFLVYINERKGD